MSNIQSGRAYRLDELSAGWFCCVSSGASDTLQEETRNMAIPSSRSVLRLVRNVIVAYRDFDYFDQGTASTMEATMMLRPQHSCLVESREFGPIEVYASNILISDHPFLLALRVGMLPIGCPGPGIRRERKHH